MQEVIQRIEAMTADERRQVKAALESLEATASAPDDAEARRRAAVWSSLEWGWGVSGGRALSEQIDEALYGGQA